VTIAQRSESRREAASRIAASGENRTLRMRVEISLSRDFKEFPKPPKSIK
jgi:hypothetical protein